MNRAELIDRLWEANWQYLTRREVEVAVAVIFDEIATALGRGQRVELRRLGAFTVRTLDAHIGRNPKTGERVAVGDKNRVHFKPSKLLHERLQTPINAEAPRRL
jgi:integration host factor subunit beta